jgi:hypothetical protein
MSTSSEKRLMPWNTLESEVPPLEGYAQTILHVEEVVRHPNDPNVFFEDGGVLSQFRCSRAEDRSVRFLQARRLGNRTFAGSSIHDTAWNSG